MKISQTQQIRKDWLENSDLSQATIHGYQFGMDTFINWAKDHNVKDINTNTLLEYKNFVDQKYCFNTARFFISTLRSFLRFCKKNNYTSTDLGEDLCYHTERRKGRRRYENL